MSAPIHSASRGSKRRAIVEGYHERGYHGEEDKVYGIIRGARAVCPVLRLLAELMGGGAWMGALVRPNTDWWDRLKNGALRWGIWWLGTPPTAHCSPLPAFQNVFPNFQSLCRTKRDQGLYRTMICVPKFLSVLRRFYLNHRAFVIPWPPECRRVTSGHCDQPFDLFNPPPPYLIFVTNATNIFV